MSSSLGHVFAAAEQAHRELPMPPVAFGVLALVAFGLGLAVLWAFRGTANKVAGPPHHTRADERS
jgi:hypothetical protein